MNLLLDVDGCIARYDFPAMIKDWFGKDIRQEDINSYSLTDCLGVPPDKVNKMFETEAFAAPNFVTGALSTLKRLSVNHLLFIWTYRLQFMTMQELLEWLVTYKIPFAEVIQRVGDKPKGFFDYFVDDSPEKLLTVDGTVSKRLLFHQPWNKHCKNILGLMRRVNSWKEIEEIINDNNGR